LIMAWVCQSCGQLNADDAGTCPCGQRRQEALPSQVGSRYPVSNFCPRCGKAPYTKTKPEGLVALANDRICLVCGTRFTPPAPVWHGYGFIALGVFLLAVIPVSLLWRFFTGGAASLLGIGVDVLFLAIGIAAISLGRRHLASKKRRGPA
jgi:hypothetical protein